MASTKEMQARAKTRKKVEQAKTSPKQYIKNNVSGFIPDAGFNSPAFVESHYWFQISDLAMYLVNKAQRNIPYKSYIRQGKAYLELDFTVDIMDQDGDVQVMPHLPKGYMATVRFTSDDIRELANTIAKGGMSARISGIPDGQTHIGTTGEKFMAINYTSSFAKGNDSGHMTFMFPSAVNNNFIKVSSLSIYDTLIDFAKHMDMSV